MRRRFADINPNEGPERWLNSTRNTQPRKTVIQAESSFRTSASSTAENQQQHQQQRETSQRKSSSSSSKSANINMKRQDVLCRLCVTTVPPPPPPSDRTTPSTFDPLLAAKHFVLNTVVTSSTPLSRADICGGLLNGAEDLFYAIEVFEALIQSDYLTISMTTTAYGSAAEKLEVNTTKLAAHPLPPCPDDTVEEAKSFILQLICSQKKLWIMASGLSAYICVARFSRDVRSNALWQLHLSSRIVLGWCGSKELFDQLIREHFSACISERVVRTTLFNAHLDKYGAKNIFRNATALQLETTLSVLGCSASLLAAMVSENIQGAELIQRETFLAKMFSEKMQKKYGYNSIACRIFEEKYTTLFRLPSAASTAAAAATKTKNKYEYLRR